MLPFVFVWIFHRDGINLNSRLDLNWPKISICFDNNGNINYDNHNDDSNSNQTNSYNINDNDSNNDDDDDDGDNSSNNNNNSSHNDDGISIKCQKVGFPTNEHM